MQPDDIKISVDVANRNALYGWASSSTLSPLLLEVYVNERRQAIIPCDLVREDGITTGFFFSPKGYLADGVNSIELRDPSTGKIIYSTKLAEQAPGIRAFEGKEGFMFLSSTPDNEVFNELSGQIGLSGFLTDKYRSALQLRKRLFSNSNTQYIYSVIPDKSVALKHLLALPESISEMRPSRAIEALALQIMPESLIPADVDFFEGINACYHKYDSHFNSQGAFNYFEKLIAQTKLLYPKYDSITVQPPPHVVEESFLGDLALHSCKHEKTIETVKTLYYPAHYYAVTQDDLVNGNVFKKTTCKTGIPLKVGVVGTSSAALLFQFFAAHFKEAFFHYSLNLTYELLMKEGADIVFHLPSERVVRNLPEDKFLLKLSSARH